MLLFLLYSGLAIALFLLVNWIGAHAVDFGYTSTTLFEEPNESVALNFFLRALSPAVFIIAISAIAVSTGYPDIRLQILWVPVIYYILRAVVIVLLNRRRLISWTRFISHAIVGVGAAWVAHRYLIIPNRSLLPDLDTAGNEVWLAILAFLYAVANKVPLAGGPGARRRNAFIRIHYEEAKARFGHLIDKKLPNEIARLIAYSILVYEDYCRPPNIRVLERAMFWKDQRTTGIMQVSATSPLSDFESVDLGTDIIKDSWESHANEEYIWPRVTATIADYNRDDDYVSKVMEVMQILAGRATTDFAAAYKEVFE